MGCIGRAPSPWGMLLLPRCLPQARRLLRAVANWMSRLSALCLQGALYFLREDRSQPAGWRSAGGGGKTWETAQRPAWLLEDLSGPPRFSGPTLVLPPLLPLPQETDWRITEIGIRNPGTSLFLPVRSYFEVTIKEDRREEVGLNPCIFSCCCAERSSQLTADALGMLCWECFWGIHVPLVSFAFGVSPLPRAWGCRPVVLLRAANNSNAELWNESRDEYCLSSEPARRFLCYWFLCMCQSPSSGLLSSPRSWSVSPVHLALSLCINKSARLFAGM